MYFVGIYIYTVYDNDLVVLNNNSIKKKKIPNKKKKTKRRYYNNGRILQPASPCCAELFSF